MGDAPNLHAELQHWFFQKLNPEQRIGFLFAAGVAPRTCDLTLGMQHEALRTVAELLSISPVKGDGECSTLVPATVAGLLGEIARIANDYDLRERIEEHDDSIADSFIWRDCIEHAASLAGQPGDEK